jgi:hypothetical protein
MADTRTVGAPADIHTYRPYVIPDGIDPPQFCIPTESSEGTYVKRTWGWERKPVSSFRQLASEAHSPSLNISPIPPLVQLGHLKVTQAVIPRYLVILSIHKFINRLCCITMLFQLH